MREWITSRLLEVNTGACWGTLIQRWSVSEPKVHPRDCTCTLCGLRSDPEKDNFHECLYYGDYSCGSTGPLAPAKPLAQINDPFCTPPTDLCQPLLIWSLVTRYGNIPSLRPTAMTIVEG